MKHLLFTLILLIGLSFVTTGNLCAQPTGRKDAVRFSYGFISVKIQGQAEVKLVSGEISAIAGLQKIKIVYNRDSTKVCDYDSEAAYLEHRCKDKDSGDCEGIRQRWANIHKEVCEPNFEDYFNRNAAKIGLVGYNNSSESLPTLLVRLRMEEPHYHTGGWNSPPYLVTECIFLDRSGHKLVAFELSAVGSPKGDNKERLRDCYAIAGKLLSKELVKYLK